MENLTLAFQTMRKAGLIARMNFWCCGNCAGFAMAEKATQLIKDGKKKHDEIKGCVFYHNQANERKRAGKSFVLSYGHIGTQKYGDVGLPTKQVGKLVSKILSVFSIPHEWDGKPESCIRILQEDA